MKIAPVMAILLIFTSICLSGCVTENSEGNLNLSRLNISNLFREKTGEPASVNISDPQDVEKALRNYDALLTRDPTNATLWARK